MKSTLTILVFSCLIILSLQSSFVCQIQGCQFCSFPNSCGQCLNNNLLQFNTSNGAFYCQSVKCPQNCATCFINNTCQVCSWGFYLTQGGSCSNISSSNSSLPSNCLWGTNSQNCSLCAYGYKLLNGYCYSYISNLGSDTACLIKLTSEICQICQSGYFVSPIGKCVQNTMNQTYCNVNNCAYCNNANATCSVCMPGFQLTVSGTCTNNTCASTGCIACSSSGQCSACSVGYQLDATTKTCELAGYGCNDPNCQVCIGPQSCGQCKPGYQLANYPQNSSNPIGICRPLTCPYNIENCEYCSFSYDSIFNYQNVLCSICESGFVLVNGYCVANLVTPTCTVQNCIQCSYNNFCKSCALGYSLTIYGTCIPAQCNIPNCASCSLNFICQQCNIGYSLALGLLSIVGGSAYGFANTVLSQCVPNSIVCNIANCGYCLSPNQCSQCASGYDFSSFSSNNCVPTCNITNCLQCTQGNTNTCSTCKPGYQSQYNGSSCQPISFTCSTGCTNSSCIYNWVTSQAQCTSCQSSMTLYNGVCYPTTCNIYGCSLCANWLTPVVCLSCNQGLVMMNGYCTITNCNNGVANCITCLQNGPCLACAQGYLLSNTSGTPSCVSTPTNCLIDNCLQCLSGNPKQCIQCASPYIVSNGICVCRFQNCLSCKQNALSCDTCPMPLFSSIQTGGCIPAPSQNHNCSVPNCDQCLTINKCSICAVGYQLNPTNMSCTLVNCSSLGLSNCQLCDPYGSSCHLCQTGYMMNSIQYGGSCYPINPNYICNITGCAVCNSTNNSICASCLPTFYANGTTQCVPNTCNRSNCYICLQNNVCSVCLAGYYLAVNMTCQPLYSNLINCQGQIPFCAMCVVNLVNNNNLNNYCIQCQDGFQFDSNNSTCIPQLNPISNCIVQMSWGTNSQPICQICQQGYFLNSFGSCSQYNPSTNTTGCNVQNCLYCGTNSTQCSFCLSPWGISSSGQCISTVDCPSNCQLCLNSTYCLTCNSSYTLSMVTNLCVQCTITGCKQCNQANVCVSCNMGYTLTLNGICLTCSVLNCNSCSSVNYCQSCNSITNGTQLSPSPSGSSCYSCNTSLPNMGQCLSCNATNSCGLCQNGYQLYIPTNSTGICIQCNIPNCQSYGLNGSNVVCSKCVLGYSVVGNSCVQCLYPCVTCTGDQGQNNCAICSAPYYFNTPLYNGSCVVNLIPNCISYNPFNTTICTTCSSGYTYNSTTNTCSFNCPSNCQQCTSSTNCTQCLTGFYLTGTNPNITCSICQLSGCSTCIGNGTICIVCANGYYLKQQECIACPGYCSACTSNNTCISLVQSQQQVLMLIGTQTVLAVCQANCQTCSNINPEICLNCQSGFYLKNGICFKCNSNCLTCNNSNPNQCLTCYPNNFLSGSTCSICSSNCLTCAGANQLSTCLSCNDGYYLSNNTCIQGCPLNCLTCSNSNACTQCLSGYTLYKQNGNVVCVTCTTLCRTCAEGQPAACLSCGVGFYLSGNTCVQCSTNCQNCSATGCSSCVSGYFLTSAQSCSPNCQLPCSTCSANNPLKCTNCIAGYSYNDISNVCNPILSCPGGCSVCPLGYSLNQGQCTACTTSQCQSCDPINPGQCYSCLPGFYLNPSNSQCSACDSSCATCLTGSGCLTCATGYTTLIDAPPTSAGYQCIACNSPCATCLNTPDYCTSCVDGYQFFGWKCAQSFYFGFNVTFLTTLATFNQNYYSFIMTLTNAINSSNPNVITIISITEGSVVVSGGAALSGGSGSQQASNQCNSLISALSTNSEISGMTIGRSAVSINGGSVNYKKTNVALILVIAGFALYVYCKKKKTADAIMQKIKQDNGYTIRQSFELSSHYRDEETIRPFENTAAMN